MHTVKRAVILAAGEGRRLRPLTLEIPKPLVPVNGTRMIDTVIGALHSNGITEIYVVVGYKKELYAGLPAQYPGLTLIENPYYESCNNISSAFVARAHLSDAIISEGDLLITDPRIFRRAFARSCYCAFPMPSAPEWSLTLDGAGTITHCAMHGGVGTHQLMGVSFWSAADGARLSAQLERAFLTDGRRDAYWDMLPLMQYSHTYALGVREIGKNDICEIDTPAELMRADPSYNTYFRGKCG